MTRSEGNHIGLTGRVEPKFQFWGERGVLLNKSLCICFCFTENVKAGVFWKEMIIFTTLNALDLKSKAVFIGAG